MVSFKRKSGVTTCRLDGFFKIVGCGFLYALTRVQGVIRRLLYNFGVGQYLVVGVVVVLANGRGFASGFIALFGRIGIAHYSGQLLGLVHSFGGLTIVYLGRFGTYGVSMQI